MKTIVITGSSSGIGKATAKHFATQGWQVAATMRKPENETELNQIENIALYQLDVTDEASIANAAEQIPSNALPRGTANSIAATIPTIPAATFEAPIQYPFSVVKTINTTKSRVT